MVLEADSIQWIQMAGQVRPALYTRLANEANDDEIGAKLAVTDELVFCCDRAGDWMGWDKMGQDGGREGREQAGDHSAIRRTKLLRWCSIGR